MMQQLITNEMHKKVRSQTCARTTAHPRTRATMLMSTFIAALMIIFVLCGCVQINTPGNNATSGASSTASQNSNGANSGQGADAQSQHPNGSAGAGAGTNANPNSNANKAAYIGLDRAKEIALTDAGVDAASATFVKEKLDYDDGREEYEVEFMVPYNNQSGQARWRYQVYEYEIDAYSGQIISYDLDLE